MRKLTILLAVAASWLLCNSLSAQNDSIPFISTLRLEVRAELEYHHTMTSMPDAPLIHNGNTYAFTGRYFNLHMGGNLTKRLSYYFRQRIVAVPGSTKFFDNTDFLYLDVKLNDQWSLRFGKDALAVGGFEYDAPPIDVLFWSYYWDNFYCFQLAAGAKFKSKDGRNIIIAQVGNSPYLHFDSPFQNSLFSYNLLWNGNFGPFQTLYSFNMFQRDKQGHFMSYLALGNKLTFNKFDLYVDFIHRATSTKQLFKDFGVIARANVYVNNDLCLFLKGGYEQNMDRDEIIHYKETGEIWDCLALPGQHFAYGGVGFEYRPKKCHDVRIHGFVADYCTSRLPETKKNKSAKSNGIEQDLTANVGVSWNIDIMKYINKRVK